MGGRVEDLVRAAAERHPRRSALAGSRETVDFAELMDRATVLAERLRRAGAGAGRAVAVRMPRSVEHAVAILACWLAGAVCVPVDPATPRRRGEAMLRVTRAGLVLAPGGDIVVTGADGGAYHSDIAYVFFTSGSSAEPKAVCVPHRGIVNEAVWTAGEFGLTERDRGSWLSSPAFAISRWELWSSLAAGACVAVAGEGVEWSAESTMEWLVRAGVTWSIAVTSLGERLFGLDWPGDGPLRLLVTGGEQLRTWPSGLPFDVVNSYGVTETSGVRSVAWLPRTPPASGLPSIGKPIANTRMYVLDDNLRPVPPGTVGQLHVGGIGLAHGYLGQPELTESRFPPDPFGPDGGRMYRTGDLALLNADGDLEFVGRGDGETKIDGVRVDVAEVEAVLLTHPAVAATAAVVRPGPRLIAHVVPRPGTDLLAHDLRSFMAERLPRALVPTAFVAAAELPRLLSGKVDRSALPEPGSHNVLTDAAIEPRDDIDREVVAACRAALGDRRPIGGHDDFFGAGGDSLALSQVRAGLAERYGITLPMAVLFEYRTPIRIAEAVRTALAARPHATAAPDQSRLDAAPRTAPLSAGQRGMWFAEQLSPDSNRYLEVITVRLTGVPDVDRVRAALAAVIARQPALRTAFDADGSEVTQVVHPEVPWELSVAAPSAGDPLADLAAQGLFEPMDLGRAPLLRARWYPGDGESVLALVIHHLVWDGTSVEVLLRDLTAFYDGLRPEELPPPVAEPEALEDLAYWRAELAGAPAVTWADPVPSTGRIGVVERMLPDGVAAALRSLAGRLGATPHMIGAACLAVALRRHHTSQEIVLSSPVSVRSSAAAGRIGLHVNMLPLRLTLSPELTGRKFVESVRRTCLDAGEHRLAPFDRIVADTVAGRRSSTEPPYSQVMFCHNRFPDETRTADGVRWLADHRPSRAPKCALMVSWNDKPTGWTVRVEHALDRIDTATAEQLAEGMITVLVALAADPDAELATLPGFPSPGTPAVPTRTAEVVVTAPAAGPAATEARDELGERIAAMWCSVLGVPEALPDANFFDQGGRSMAAMRLVTAMRSQLGMRVPVRAVFDTDSLAEFVALVRRDHAGAGKG